jgi:hypothetical protein
VKESLAETVSAKGSYLEEKARQMEQAVSQLKVE